MRDKQCVDRSLSDSVVRFYNDMCCLKYTRQNKKRNSSIFHKKLKVGNDQENAQSERNSHSKNRVGNNLIDN